MREFSTFPVVEEPPDLGPELLTPGEAEKERQEPPKKRPSTTSPSPTAAIADHMYPPAFHGAAGTQPSQSPTTVPIKRGRGALSPPRDKGTRVAAASPLALSPKATFFAINFAGQADSPLQDQTTSVKRNKATEEAAGPDAAIPQDLALQFADVQVNAFPH